MDIKYISFEDFLTQYKPVDNHLDDNASFEGIMFETFGDEAAYVKASEPEKIWTLSEDDGESFIQSGWHFVNRIGYFISEIPRKSKVQIIVPLHDGSEGA